MMVGESSQRFARSDAYDAIDLACADAEHARLIIAPATGHFDELDASLDLEGFDRIVASLVSDKVVLSMPRFRAALPATSLKSELRALGITQAFDERANLEGIARVSDAKLYVADAVRAAMIDVDEHGARGAASRARPARAGAVDHARPSVPVLVAERAHGCADRDGAVHGGIVRRSGSSARSRQERHRRRTPGESAGRYDS